MMIQRLPLPVGQLGLGVGQSAGLRFAGKADEATAPDRFESQASAAKPASKKTRWPVIAMMLAWMGTLGGGGYLGVQQYQINQSLQDQNFLLLERVHDLAKSTKMVGPVLVDQVKDSTVTILGKVAMGTQLERNVVTGSGVWIKDERTGKLYVLTNNHVAGSLTTEIENGKRKVTLPITYIVVPYGSETGVTAKTVFQDKGMDLAIMEVSSIPDGVKPVVIRDIGKDPLAVGERVFAIGAPVGLRDTVTSGILSHLNRDQMGETSTYVQTDTPINSGNSGGGLFDMEGRLVAINTAVVPNRDGLGFSIRTDSIRSFLTRGMEALGKQPEKSAEKASSEPVHVGKTGKPDPTMGDDDTD